MENIISDLIEILKDRCPYSLINKNNYFNLYNTKFLMHELYCHYDHTDCTEKLCNSCREIIDLNLNKSVFIKYIKRIENL